MPQDRLEQWSRYVRAAGIDAMFVGEEWEDYLSTQVYALGLCLSLATHTHSLSQVYYLQLVYQPTPYVYVATYTNLHPKPKSPNLSLT
tara:strand:+ start:121 stop:384 length:264 start_codon:yes stop_codon:yes gene_type:complete